MGSCILGGGGNVIHDFWYLKKGEGMKVTRNYFFPFDLVLIFIKQYSDSMCVSSIFSWKLQIIPYLCEIDVRTLPPFGPHKNDQIRTWCQNFINCSIMNSYIIWYPLLYRTTPIFSRNGDWKLDHMSYLPVVASLKSNNNALHGKLYFSINNYKNPSFIQINEYLTKNLEDTTALRTLHIANFRQTLIKQNIQTLLPFHVS